MNRIVPPEVWQCPRFQALPAAQKNIVLWLLTNDGIGLAGYQDVMPVRVRGECGANTAELWEAVDALPHWFRPVDLPPLHPGHGVPGCGGLWVRTWYRWQFAADRDGAAWGKNTISKTVAEQLAHIGDDGLIREALALYPGFRSRFPSHFSSSPPPVEPSAQPDLFPVGGGASGGDPVGTRSPQEKEKEKEDLDLVPREEGVQGEKGVEPPAKPPPPPQSAIPPPQSDDLRPRVDALDDHWAGLPWDRADRDALREAAPSLRALQDRDWQRLRRYRLAPARHAPHRRRLRRHFLLNLGAELDSARRLRWRPPPALQKPTSIEAGKRNAGPPPPAPDRPATPAEALAATARFKRRMAS